MSESQNRWGDEALAAIDLGSNSCRLEIARLRRGDYKTLAYWKEPIRLGAGLDADGMLTEAATARALACLSRFGAELKGFAPERVRALQAARASGALTIGIANNPGSPLAAYAEIGITLDTGAEVISGSTRLKAGTAQKIALNTFSSALMVRLHKVYGNLMVDLRATNAKLLRRAQRLTMEATACSAMEAERTLQACDYRIKVAIVALKRRIDTRRADGLLRDHGGSVRGALAAPVP